MPTSPYGQTLTDLENGVNEVMKDFLGLNDFLRDNPDIGKKHGCIVVQSWTDKDNDYFQSIVTLSVELWICAAESTFGAIRATSNQLLADVDNMLPHLNASTVSGIRQFTASGPINKALSPGGVIQGVQGEGVDKWLAEVTLSGIIEIAVSRSGCGGHLGAA